MLTLWATVWYGVAVLLVVPRYGSATLATNYIVNYATFANLHGPRTGVAPLGHHGGFGPGPGGGHRLEWQMGWSSPAHVVLRSPRSSAPRAAQRVGIARVALWLHAPTEHPHSLLSPLWLCLCLWLPVGHTPRQFACPRACRQGWVPRPEKLLWLSAHVTARRPWPWAPPAHTSDPRLVWAACSAVLWSSMCHTALSAMPPARSFPRHCRLSFVALQVPVASAASSLPLCYVRCMPTRAARSLGHRSS